MPKARAPAKRWLEEKQGAIGGCQTVCLGCFWSGFLVGCFLSRDWLSFFFFLLSLTDWLLRVSLLFSVALWSQIDFQFSPNLCP